MLTFKQFYQKELKENRRSMGRSMHHVSKDPYVIIMSVERNPYEVGRNKHVDWDYSDPKNRKKAVTIGAEINTAVTAEFRKHLGSFKSGFIPIEGTYLETLKLPSGEQEQIKVDEQSTIVYCTETNKDRLYKFCIGWAKQYNQQAILVVEKGKGYYVDPQNNKREYIGIFYPDDIEQYCSVLVGNKKFTFTKNKQKITQRLKDMFNLDDV